MKSGKNVSMGSLLVLLRFIIMFPIIAITMSSSCLALQLPSLSFTTRRTIRREYQRTTTTTTNRWTLLHPVLFMSSKSGGTKQTLGPGSHTAELEVKKSRFIGYATHVHSWEDAVQYLESIRKQQHPKARHWCYGYVCGTNERSSDDGEPSGTAGVPILNAIRGAHLDNVMCVIVRYFGGIKLGTGGLIRAYGGTARLVLRDAPVQTLIPQSTVRVSVDAPFIGAIYELISKVYGTASRELYGEHGNLTITITCDQTNEIRLRNGLQDVTRGSAIFVDDDLI